MTKQFADPPEGSEPFFKGAREGRLMIQRCPSCGAHQFYPRPVCVRCGAPEPEWVQAAGTATVHTFTVIHQNRMPGWSEQLPYVVAVVDLDEGARMTTNIVDCDPDAAHVGMPVEVTFVDEDGVTLPRFRPRVG